LAESGSSPAGGVLSGPARTGGEEPAPKDRYDVFISYNRKDEGDIRRIVERLERRGIRAWVDWQMEGGADWLGEIERAIPEVGVFVCFVGPHFEPAQSESLQNVEIKLAFQGRCHVIPVRLPNLPQNYKPSGLLGTKQWLDFHPKISSKAVEKLVAAIRSGIEARSARISSVLSGEEPGKEELPAQRWWRKRLRAAMLLLSLLVLLTAAVLLLRGEAFGVRQPPAPIPESLKRHALVPVPRFSVAVLSFENRSRLPDLDWLSTALAEAVAAQLGAGDAVRVVDRHEVALAETDLLLSNPKMEVQAQDSRSLRSLLGADFLVGGAYEPAGIGGMRLDLALYDARDGRRIAEASEEGKETAWLDLARAETFLGTIVGSSSTGGPRQDLRALFPSTREAMKSYAEGLARYRRFDVESARALFATAIGREPRPLMLASLAKAEHFLGRTEEAVDAIGKAMELDRRARSTPRALPPRYRVELQALALRIDEDPEKAAEAAESAERLFREYSPDDVGYGLAAVEALADARLEKEALMLLQEIRGLPLADQNPRIDLAEAEILLDEQQYRRARSSATRAITKARAARALRQEALSSLLLASVASSTGETLQAERLFRQAREGFHRVRDSLNSVRSLEGVALLYVNHDLPTAEKLYRQVIQEYQTLRDGQQQARALFGLSAVLTLRDDLLQAQACAEEADRMAGESSLSLRSLTEYDFGTMLYFAGRLSEAGERYEAARVLIAGRNPHLHAYVLTGLGEIEAMRGSFGEARDLIGQAMAGYNGVKDFPGVAYSEILLGRLAAATGNYSDARDRFKRALTKLDSTETGSSPESESFVEALLASAELELDSGRPDQAGEAAGRAEDVAEGVGLNAGQSRALALQARALLEQGRREEAEKAAAKAVRLARGDFRAVREAKIVEARVRAASGQVEAALRDLERISRETAQTGQLVYRFESLLAAGTIELENGRVHEGRRRLEELRTEAEDLGFDQMVRRIDTARGETSSERGPAR
jgi:tetratricopeptide (TPR) repeat protein